MWLTLVVYFTYSQYDQAWCSNITASKTNSGCILHTCIAKAEDPAMHSIVLKSSYYQLCIITFLITNA